MSSPHKPLPKPSRVAKMSVRPVWIKKLNYGNTSNEVDVNLPTLMPKPQSSLKESSQENPPTTLSNHDSLQPHSFSFGDSCDTNVGQAFIPLQSVNQTQLTQPSFPHLLINPHVASVLHAQTPPSPHGDSQTQPPLPPSPSIKMLINDNNQLQDLLNLLDMHLSKCNTPSSPYSSNLPHILNLNQVEHRVGYCLCCIVYPTQQFLTLVKTQFGVNLLLTRHNHTYMSNETTLQRPPPLQILNQQLTKHVTCPPSRLQINVQPSCFAIKSSGFLWQSRQIKTFVV
ncbi:hypothetical protein Tco_0341390 [Tanacetum coccineum]